MRNFIPQPTTWNAIHDTSKRNRTPLGNIKERRNTSCKTTEINQNVLKQFRRHMNLLTRVVTLTMHSVSVLRYKGV